MLLAGLREQGDLHPQARRGGPPYRAARRARESPRPTPPMGGTGLGAGPPAGNPSRHPSRRHQEIQIHESRIKVAPPTDNLRDIHNIRGIVAVEDPDAISFKVKTDDIISDEI